MALNKFDHRSDAIANLYRAALYLTKGSEEIGMEFFFKAEKVLQSEIDPNLIILSKKFQEKKDKNNNIYLAEKILDQYLVLK